MVVEVVSPANPLGVWFLTAARLGQNALGFLVAVVVLRKFGIEAVGTLTVASFGVALQATLLNFGMPHVLARSTLPLPERNTIVLCVACAGMLISAPFSFAIGFGFGHDYAETIAIVILSLTGAYFAQTALLDALHVLQNRAWLSPVGVMGGFLGLVAAAWYARSLIEFAVVLALGRFMGVMTIFMTLKFRWCGWRQLVAHVKGGFLYLVPDSLGLLSEQLVVAVVAALASRSELGLFGLCRQFLTAGEAPLWSKLATLYPQFCAQPALSLRQVRPMGMKGVWVAMPLAALAVLLALSFYGSKQMVYLAPLLLLSLPFRYAAGTAEVGLRAMGSIRAINGLGLFRLGLLASIPLAYWAWSLPGVFSATVLQCALMAWLADRALRSAGKAADVS